MNEEQAPPPRDESELTCETSSLPLLDDPGIEDVPVGLAVQVGTPSRFQRPLEVKVRRATLLTGAPWVRSLGKVEMDVSTQGWRFPIPPDLCQPPPAKESAPAATSSPSEEEPVRLKVYEDVDRPARTRLRPASDSVMIKDRLLYLLQPPLETLFEGKQACVPFQPYPYQLQGIAFLMPRHSALLADEMGLGKTVQVILSLRLLFQANLIRKALVVCPKPLVINWSRELRLWAEDIPFEVISGDTQTRRVAWRVSNCPLKLVNYEILTRDADEVADEAIRFDVVVLDEAQRIKSHDSKTSQVVRSLHRDRSWAMSGTPIENRTEDLVNIFAFVDPDRIPHETPASMLPELTRDSILRRTKEDVAEDMPPRIIRDTFLELTPEQRHTYELAEKDGVVHLNSLGDTITIQHVFELVMRLKQICNFDPRTGESAKQDQLVADVAEVAASGRKAIVFSQWVEPLETLGRALQDYGPLLYHGRVPHRLRQPILDQFKSDSSKHVLLMSYGTGSVGLNLQFCNYVFLFDRWWNPAIEDQAINRAHRLGVKSSVYVSRFITPGTIEERIAEVLEKKRQLFRELIEQNGPPVVGLTEDEIFGLFELKARPRRAA